MSVTSPAKSQVIAIEKVPRQYSYAALAFMQIAAGGSAGNFDCLWFAQVALSLKFLNSRQFCSKVRRRLGLGAKTHIQACKLTRIL